MSKTIYLIIVKNRPHEGAGAAGVGCVFPNLNMVNLGRRTRIVMVVVMLGALRRCRIGAHVPYLIYCRSVAVRSPRRG